MGNSPKRLLLFILALVSMVLFLIEKSAYEYHVILIMVVFGYLALLVVMSCMGRGGMGQSAGFEGAAGLMLLVYSITFLVNRSSRNNSEMIAIILSLILGALFLIFNLF